MTVRGETEEKKMETKTVHVSAGDGYDVIIGPGLLDRAGELVRERTGLCRAAIIADSRTRELFMRRAADSMAAAGFSVASYAFPEGEASKTLGTASDILEFLAESGMTRADLVVALGGGVTGDMAGFAAAVYMRGIRYVQIPTTLLAAVDSSVGGKTAVDLREGKNLAGAFKQPELVICDTDALATLPARERSCGMAEIVKYAVLTGEPLRSILEREDLSASMAEIIGRCVAYKAALVARDEHDTGDRQLLNLGHTIGHAVERLSRFTVPHGEAVAIGLNYMARACEKMGKAPAGFASAVRRLTLRYGLPVSCGRSARELYDASASDKKRDRTGITLVVPHGFGDCELCRTEGPGLMEYIRLGEDRTWM